MYQQEPGHAHALLLGLHPRRGANSDFPTQPLPLGPRLNGTRLAPFPGESL